MADLSSLSLEELQALKKSKPLDSLSLEQLQELKKSKTPSPEKEFAPKLTKQEALNAVQTAGNISAYPFRVAKTAIQAALTKGVTASDVLESALTPAHPTQKLLKIGSGKELARTFGIPMGVTPAEKRISVNIPFTDQALDVTGVGEDVRDLAAEIVTDLAISKGVNTATKGIKSVSGKLFSAPKVKGVQVEPSVFSAADVEAARAKQGADLLSKQPEALFTPVESTKRVVGDFVRKVKPTELSPKLNKRIAVASEIGITPDDFTDPLFFDANSSATKAYQTRAQSPNGSALLDKHNILVDKVESGLLKKADDLAGGRLIGVDDALSYGNTIKDDFKIAQNAIKNKIDWDRSSAYKMNPGIMMKKKDLGELKLAIELAKKDNNVLANATLNAELKNEALTSNELLGRISKSIEGGDMEAVHDTLKELGHSAFELPTRPQSGKILKDLYFKTGNLYDSSAGAYYGKDIQKSIKEGSALWTKFLKSKSEFGKTLGNDFAPPEEVFKSLIARGDSVELDNYLDLLKEFHPEGLQNAKAIYSKQLINSSKNQASYGFANLMKNMKDQGTVWRHRKFMSPEEYNKFMDIAELGKDTLGKLNPSGAAEMQGWRQWLKAPFGKEAALKNYEQLTRKKYDILNKKK